jgi:hypothetical protein
VKAVKEEPLTGEKEISSAEAGKTGTNNKIRIKTLLSIIFPPSYQKLNSITFYEENSLEKPWIVNSS